MRRATLKLTRFTLIRARKRYGSREEGRGMGDIKVEGAGGWMEVDE